MIHFRKRAIRATHVRRLKIANCYILGYGRERDYGKAEEWLSKAIDAGSDRARVSLAGLILFKLADKCRYSEAVSLLESPADSGNSQAAFALSLAYRNGMGTAVDIAESTRQLKQAASANHLVATFVQFGQLVIGEQAAGSSHGVGYWRAKLNDSIASSGFDSVEAFKKRVADDYLISGFVFSEQEVEKILEQL